MRRLPPLVLGLTLLLQSNLSQAATAQAAAAEKLFNEGRELMSQEKWDEACPLLAESQKLDPGTGTLLNLATCYEQAGRRATAWLTWLEAARSAREAGQTEREQLARERAEELEGTLGTLTVLVPENAPAELNIQRNGEELPPGTWGIALPLDAQSYTLRAAAPGYQAHEESVSIIDGENTDWRVPALQAQTQSSTTQESTDTASSSQKTWGYISAGTGVLGLATGGVLGLVALSKNNSSKEHCFSSDPNLCNQTGVDLRNQAFDFATGASIAAGVGAAALIAGAVLIFTAPESTTQIVASPHPQGGSLLVRGTF